MKIELNSKFSEKLSNLSVFVSFSVFKKIIGERRRSFYCFFCRSFNKSFISFNLKKLMIRFFFLRLIFFCPFSVNEKKRLFPSTQYYGNECQLKQTSVSIIHKVNYFIAFLPIDSN